MCCNSSCAYIHGDWIFQLVISFYRIDLGTDPKSLNCDDVLFSFPLRTGTLSNAILMF